MSRFFVNMPLQTGAAIRLPDEVARHIQVLRLQTGTAITLFDGTGGEYRAGIVSMEKRDVRVQIGPFSAIEAEPPYRLTLVQGIAGNDRMDWLIEKAVELGVSGFVPLATARSVVRLSGERAQKRHAHWQRIVQSACEQCGRNRPPAVTPARDFHAWLDALPPTPADHQDKPQEDKDQNEGENRDEGGLKILFSPRASAPFATLPLAPPTGETLVLIGPEGGLSDDEENAARKRGFTAISLGARVLRTETAGIAVLAALLARWGGW